MTAAQCLEDDAPHELLSEEVNEQNVKQWNETNSSSSNSFGAAAATGSSSAHGSSSASSSATVINRVASHHAASSAAHSQAYNALGLLALFFVSAMFF